MPKRESLCREQKRTRIMELFHDPENATPFFTMKELEPMAQKKKGVVSQSVKEIIEELVSEGLLESDKIGTYMLYWDLPSNKQHKRTRQMAELDAKLEAERQKQAELAPQLKKLRAACRSDDPTRRKYLETSLKDFAANKKRLQESLSKYPDRKQYEELVAAGTSALHAANRWTDNLHEMYSYVQQMCGREEANAFFTHQIGLDYATLDYIEDSGITQ